MRDEQCRKVCRILDDVLANRPTERDALIVAVRTAFNELKERRGPVIRWIPCEERLPEDEQEILFSTKTGRVHSGRYHDDNSANQWYSHRDRGRAWNNVVIAWMPLPKPYKGEGG